MSRWYGDCIYGEEPYKGVLPPKFINKFIEYNNQILVGSKSTLRDGLFGIRMDEKIKKNSDLIKYYDGVSSL